MIKDRARWEQWEAEFQASQPVNYWQNLALFQSMLEEATRLGVFPPDDPLEGLEVDIRLARAINLV
jgi:hypothetical protein